jgi:hypothetical protein
MWFVASQNQKNYGALWIDFVATLLSKRLISGVSNIIKILYSKMIDLAGRRSSRDTGVSA